IAVKIAPGGAHSSSSILHARLGSHICESAIPVVSIKILSSKIVGHEKIRPTVIVVVPPSTSEAVAVVILIEARLLGDGLEGTIASIAVHDVRRPIGGVVVRTGHLCRRHWPAISANV